MSLMTKPLAHYSHIRKAGDIYYVAGQGCRNPETNEYAGLTRDSSGAIQSYDIKAQSKAVLANIEQALATESLTLDHVIDVNVFLADMKDFAGMNEIWNQTFANRAQKPTRTTVAVKQLPGDNFVEMKAIAYRSQK